MWSRSERSRCYFACRPPARFLSELLSPPLVFMCSVQNKVRCPARSFVERGGLGLVMQLLPHPDLQYFAMSALVVLLGSPGSAVYEHPELASDALQQVRSMAFDRGTFEIKASSECPSSSPFTILQRYGSHTAYGLTQGSNGGLACGSNAVRRTVYSCSS